MLSSAMEYDNQAISLILLHHNFLLCFEVLQKKTKASNIYPCNTATKTTTKWAGGRQRHHCSDECGCKWSGKILNLKLTHCGSVRDRVNDLESDRGCRIFWVRHFHKHIWIKFDWVIFSVPQLLFCMLHLHQIPTWLELKCRQMENKSQAWNFCCQHKYEKKKISLLESS